MADYTIEDRCDIHESLIYVVMRDGKDYAKTDDKTIAKEIVAKLYVADIIISNL